ncbi:formyltransferase family protein [Aeromonas enteropelogenes]|uniref:formyltransferase family protein n=1 Tax=Aeromonas enteropelogenes TaxID=29489 RepID=UPI0038CFA84C
MNQMKSNSCSNEILFIGDHSFWSECAYEFLNLIFNRVTAIFWSYGEKKDAMHRIIYEWSGDWVISFKSDLILDKVILKHANKGAINFHPAPVKYRGIGGYYYAINDKDSKFGVTCHYIDDAIDHGTIIKSIEFMIIDGETVEELEKRTANYCLTLFYEICSLIAKGQALPVCGKKWEGKLYTRKMLKHYLDVN